LPLRKSWSVRGGYSRIGLACHLLADSRLLTAIFRLPGRPRRKGTSQANIDLPSYGRADFADSLSLCNMNCATQQELAADASGQQDLNPAGTDRFDTIRSGFVVFDQRVDLADKWMRVLDCDAASRIRPAKSTRQPRHT
jgi:hypothetical protein